MIRVVHFWNICGIGGLLARYLDRDFNYQSVAVDRGHANMYGHNNEKTLVWENRALVWLARCFFFAGKFDIIHIHSGIQWLPFFRIRYPGKKLIIHLHGTNIRGRWDEYDALKYADKILVSTPDLLDGSPNGVVYLPNPVDEELISKIQERNIQKEKGWAFHVNQFAIDKAKEYSERHGLKLNLFNKEENPHYFHEDFLAHVAQFEYYIDVKRDYPGTLYEKKILKAWSLTGLEALALGSKGINWQGVIHKGLPHEHRSFNIASQLHGIYQGLF